MPLDQWERTKNSEKDVSPLPGDCVVVVIRGKYGKYRAMRLNADGDLWGGNGGFVPKGFYTVCDVVIDRVPKGS